MPATAFVAFGSNLGDRRHHLDAAVLALRAVAGVRLVQVSRYWETNPVGGPLAQCMYLNAAAQVETTLTPRELLSVFLAIENQQGRIRETHHGPRTLDLDLLLYDDAVLNEPDLIVPHPRLHERTFVLGPLAEIAPLARHPVLGQTAVELLARLRCRPLHGLRALVTGSSSGIGRAIAIAFAEQGADVLIHAGKSSESAAAVADAVQHQGVRTRVLLADLRDTAACQRLVDDAWATWGRLDVWVNNAGADILTGGGARAEFALKLHELFAVDVRATMLLGRAAGARMKVAGQGVLINMGWDQAETGMEGDSGQLFAGTKAAVMAFTKSLALSLAPAVRVNCLAPGWIRTAWGENASEAWQQRAVGETPLARWGTPEDVAAAASWLASPAAAFVTGQIIRVNGGAVR